MANQNMIYQPLEYTDLTERTYRVLKDKILRGELKPGAQISVPQVALALGVSRTPVNDALKRLASDGLVEIVPRQGSFVTEMTAREVAEIYDMRLMIELYAAETIIEAPRVAQFLDAVSSPMIAMEQAIDGNTFRDYESFTVNDREFHTALVKLTGNHRLMRTYTQLHVHAHGARIHFLDHDDAQQAHNQHKAIVEAFKHHSVEQAKAALRVHILSVKTRLLEVLESRGGKL
jgi:DNA-binding GntR family transcriptional regulator